MLPIEIQYSPYAFNNLPRTKNIPPNNLFYSTEVPQHRLQIIHVRRCPVYVLNPSLQAGGKIPRWEPCSKREVFCDHSKYTRLMFPRFWIKLLGVLPLNSTLCLMICSSLCTRLWGRIYRQLTGMVYAWKKTEPICVGSSSDTTANKMNPYYLIG